MARVFTDSYFHAWHESDYWQPGQFNGALDVRSQEYAHHFNTAGTITRRA